MRGTCAKRRTEACLAPRLIRLPCQRLPWAFAIADNYPVRLAPLTCRRSTRLDSTPTLPLPLHLPPPLLCIPPISHMRIVEITSSPCLLTFSNPSVRPSACIGTANCINLTAPILLGYNASACHAPSFLIVSPLITHTTHFWHHLLNRLGSRNLHRRLLRTTAECGEDET